MGWCHEYGVVICEGCSAPMVAGGSSCSCPECGTECGGRFASCADVWAAGPRLVAVRGREGPASRRDRPSPPVAVEPPPSLAVAVPAAAPAPPPAPDPSAPSPAPVPADEPGRPPPATADVLAWMAGAVDDLRSEVQQVGESLAAQQDVLDRLSGAGAGGDRGAGAGEPLLVAELRSWIAASAERDALVAEALAALPGRLADELAGNRAPGADANARLAHLADNLPNRLGAAIAAAIEGRQEAYLHRVEHIAAGLSAALAGVTSALAELRGQLDRADPVDLRHRIDRLAARVEELAGTPAAVGRGAPPD